MKRRFALHSVGFVGDSFRVGWFLVAPVGAVLGHLEGHMPVLGLGSLL